MDLGFFDNRIYLTAEYYKKDTKDLLINATLPAHTVMVQHIGI